MSAPPLLVLIPDHVYDRVLNALADAGIALIETEDGALSAAILAGPDLLDPHHNPKETPDP